MAFKNPSAGVNVDVGEIAEKLDELKDNIAANTEMIKEILANSRDIKFSNSLAASETKESVVSETPFSENGIVSEEIKPLYTISTIPDIFSTITDNPNQRCFTLSSDMILKLKSKNGKNNEEEIKPITL